MKCLKRSCAQHPFIIGSRFVVATKVVCEEQAAIRGETNQVEEYFTFRVQSDLANWITERVDFHLCDNSGIPPRFCSFPNSSPGTHKAHSWK
jgi:hypothetical protein